MNRIAKILAAIFLLMMPLAGLADDRLPVSTLEIATRDGKAHFFTIEMAETPEQHAKGLMFRTEMADDAGMLFMFKDKPYAAMWMKNTLISLDMLFIDEKGKVMFIAENTVPESLEPISAYAPTAAVLELKGGITKKLAITVGDTAKHHYFGN